jgi:UDP-N-acetylglucosamine 2-epimerase
MPEKKILLLAYTKDDVVNARKLIRKHKKNENDIVFLGLDFSAWIELRKMGILYRTPSEFFDEKNGASIDLEALHLAKTWYEAIETQITYHGICLGEMVEYNFVYIFRNALKSIEIGYSLFDEEKPDEVWLPKNIPSFAPSNIRNESLTKAVASIASSRQIPVTYINSKKITKNIENIVNNFTENMVIDSYWKLKGFRKKLAKYSKYYHKIVFINLSTERFFTIKKDLKKNKTNMVINLKDIKELKSFVQINHKAAEFIEKSARSENAKTKNEIIYKGISVLKTLISERISEFFSDTMHTLVNYVDAMEVFIKDVKPDVVITMEDISPSLRVITRVCKINGVHTLVLQHGALAFDMQGFHVMPVEADKQAVWGEKSKSWAIHRGKSSESQIVTGNPRFDLLISVKNSFKKENSSVYNKLGLNREKGIILIATQWYSEVGSCCSPKTIERFIWKSLEAAKNFPERQVVVKLHPSYHQNYKEIVSAIVTELDMKNVVVTEKHLWQLLASCDVLIIQSSTVGLEAMLFDKPVITLNSVLNNFFNPYAETGAVIEINDEENLVPAITAALNDEKIRLRLKEGRERYVYDYAYAQDGEAGKRVAVLIQQMIDAKAQNL